MRKRAINKRVRTLRIASTLGLVALLASCGGTILEMPPGSKSISVSGLSAAATTSTATITWTTSDPTTHVVEYGTSSGSYGAATVESTTPDTTHTVTLTSLASNTAYYYRARNYSATLPDTVSAEQSFTTAAPQGPGTITASDPSTSGITETTATVSWTTDVPATHLVMYGTSTGVYTTSTIESTTPDTTHSVTLVGLTPGTTYYYCARSNSATLPDVVSAEHSFTTTAAPAIIASDPSTSLVTETSARVSWTTNVATTHLVEYGTASGVYTYSTVESSTASTSHDVDLTGLSPSTTYYYRAHSYSMTLPEVVSAEHSFTTSTPTPPTLAQKIRGIWMVGGLSGATVATVIDQLDLFDPATGQWYPSATSFTAGAMTPVSFAGAVGYTRPLDGHHLIVVIGGFDAAGNVRNLVQIYDVEANTWSSGAPMQGVVSPRANFTAVTVFGKVYVISGTTGNAALAYGGSTTVYEYAIDSDSWSNKSPATPPATGSERLALAFNNTVYYTGGRTTATAVTTTTEGYSTTLNNTTTGTTEVALTLARTGLAGALYVPATGPARIFLIGGVGTLTGTTSNCVISAGTTGPTPQNLFQLLDYPFVAPSTWTATALPVFPVNICFGSAAIYGDTLYHFGGTTTVVAFPTPQASGQASVYSYNLLTLPPSWPAPTSMPIGRYGHVAVTFP